MFVLLASLLYAQEPPSSEEESTSPNENEEENDQDADEAESSDEKPKTEGIEKEESSSIDLEQNGPSPAENFPEGGNEPQDASNVPEPKVMLVVPEVVEDSTKVITEEVSEPKDEIPPVAERRRGEIVLKNGDRIHGLVTETNEEGIQLDIGSGGDILIPEHAIGSVLYLRGKYHLEDLGHNRYFYTPTAIPMEKKTGYLSQKELLFTAVAYSPSQDWSVLAGTSIPFVLFALSEWQTDTLIGVLGVRYGTNVGENLYVGGGVESFVLQDTNFILPFVNATYGDSEQHITAAVGVGISDFETPRLLPVNISAYKRISRSLAFVTENWLVGFPSTYFQNTDTPIQGTDCGPNGEPCYQEKEVVEWDSISFDILASAVGIRFISQRFTTDVAIVNMFIQGDYVPIPWLDVSWYFGADIK